MKTHGTTRSLNKTVVATEFAVNSTSHNESVRNKDFEKRMNLIMKLNKEMQSSEKMRHQASSAEKKSSRFMSFFTNANKLLHSNSCVKEAKHTPASQNKKLQRSKTIKDDEFNHTLVENFADLSVKSSNYQKFLKRCMEIDYNFDGKYCSHGVKAKIIKIENPNVTPFYKWLIRAKHSTNKGVNRTRKCELRRTLSLPQVCYTAYLLLLNYFMHALLATIYPKVVILFCFYLI